MAGLQLTRGEESRTGGAPFIPVDMRDEYLRVRTRELMALDPEMDELVAAQQAQAEIDAATARRQQQEAEMAARSAARQAERAAARGVNPESLDFQASARDVQLMNRTPEEAEAILRGEEATANRIIRGSREGRRDWEAESDRNYQLERGEQNPLAGDGNTDMAIRRRLMEERGQFFEMPDGTRIPVGADPTAASMRNLRGFEDWANETPGTERQALYNPAGYEEFREGVRQEIQDRARQQLETYGDGLANPTQKQLDAREARKASEERVNNSPWQVRQRRQQLAMRAGLTPAQAAEAISEKYVADGAPLSFEDQLRMRGDLSRIEARQLRKGKVAQQAELAGGQPTGGPFGTKATTTAINQLGPGWREIALLDRLTQGRVGGPTPLGVDAVGAQNAMRMLDAQALAGMNPAARGLQELQAAGAEANLPTPVRAERERAANNGVLPAQSAAGQAVLAEIAADVIGDTYATDYEFNAAVDAAVAEGVPRADAESYYRIYARKKNRGVIGTILGAGKGAPPESATPATAPQAAAAAAAGPVPVVPFVPPPIPLR